MSAQKKNLEGWTRASRETLVSHPVIGVSKHRLTRPDGSCRDAIVLDTSDWVNIIPVTSEGEVVLIRQWRFGIEDFSLEIPGGMVEPGETGQAAAARELLEETGYRSLSPPQHLGTVHPNPAIQANRCSMWLADDIEWVEEAQGDGEEEIDVVRVALATLPEMVRSGEITHSLVMNALHLWHLHQSNRPGKS